MKSERQGDRAPCKLAEVGDQAFFINPTCPASISKNSWSHLTEVPIPIQGSISKGTGDTCKPDVMVGDWKLNVVGTKYNTLPNPHPC